MEGRKKLILSAACLFYPSVLLMAGTYRPRDGMLSFLLLLGFLLILLGIMHLADLLRSALQKLKNLLNFEDIYPDNLSE